VGHHRSHKLLTKTIEIGIANAVDRVLTDKQKGCRSRVFGAQHQLIIDRVLAEQDRETTKDLARVWLDMRKDFDSTVLLRIRHRSQGGPYDQTPLRAVANGSTADGRVISDPIPIIRVLF
jgi:hypothetical protein